MQKFEISVKGETYCIFDASEDCGNGAQGYVHLATRTVFIGGVSATRHIFGADISFLPNVIDREGTPQLGPSWEPLNVSIWLPGSNGENGYWREWNDHTRGAVWNSGGYRPSLGYSPTIKTAEHPDFWQMSLETALKAWLAAKEHGKRDVTVYHDSQGEYAKIGDEIQYL